jgi:hypothetical protein
LSISESDLDKLDPASQEQWANEVRTVQIQINKLTTAKLVTLSDKFKKREMELVEATTKLEKDLQSLKNAVQIINVVSGGLKLVTNIVKLIA